ncbi:MAG: hypothetical protein QXN01_00590 [Candidatus Anstonellales archaeon]
MKKISVSASIGSFILVISPLLFLVGCVAQTAYTSCCASGNYTSSFQCRDVLSLNGSQRLECPSISDLGPENERLNCTYYCDPSICPADANGNPQWCPPGCVNGVDSKIPVCGQIPSDPCIAPDCAAMICGRTSYNPRISMSLSDYLNARDRALPQPQDLNPTAFSTSSFDFTDVPEGLFGTFCSFKPLNKETNREFKSSPTAFINTFRFGVANNFSTFEEARLYTPISDVFCGFSDYNKYQKDRYLNYVERQFASGPLKGYLIGYTTKWGEAHPVNSPSGVLITANCYSNIDELLRGTPCEDYKYGDGGECHWTKEFNISIVKRIKWTCASTGKQYSSKGACMDNCYPQRSCSLPTGQADERVYLPFLARSQYVTTEEKLNISRPNGTLYATETTKKIDTDYYISKIKEQYEFEIANGYCPEPGCVCYLDENSNNRLDNEEQVGPELCDNRNSKILNIIPGASALCQSNGECYSGICNKNILPTNKCILKDGTPVDCGCYIDSFGKTKCKVNALSANEKLPMRATIHPRDTSVGSACYVCTGGNFSNSGSSQTFRCAATIDGNTYSFSRDGDSRGYQGLGNQDFCPYEGQPERAIPPIPDERTLFPNDRWSDTLYICHSISVGSGENQQGVGQIGDNHYNCRYWYENNRLEGPLEIDMSKTTTSNETSRAYTVLYNSYYTEQEIKQRIPLLSACNMRLGTDFHIRYGTFTIFELKFFDHEGGSLDWWPHELFWEPTRTQTLVLITPHQGEGQDAGKILFGDCLSDPEREGQLLIYSWGGCEPCSLSTSAVQQISPTEQNTPVCLTQSESYGECTASNGYCYDCAPPSPFKSYNDTDAKGVTVYVQDEQPNQSPHPTMTAQGPSFLPDPNYLHVKIQKYQKASTLPILVVPNTLPYLANVTSFSCIGDCEDKTMLRCEDSPSCEWTGSACASNGWCEQHNPSECYSYYSCRLSPQNKFDTFLPANLAKYLKDQGTTILALHTINLSEVTILNNNGQQYLLRNTSKIEDIKNKVIYYKRKFPHALTAVIIPALRGVSPTLDGEAIPMQDVNAISYALLLNEQADGNVQTINGITYKRVVHTPSPGTIDTEFLKELDLIIIMPYIPEMAYYSGGNPSFCALSPEEQALLMATNLTNASRKLLMDFNLPSLIYFGERATEAPQCDSWQDIDRARLIQELIKLSSNLSSSGIIGIHEPRNELQPYGFNETLSPEEQPFCVIQNASRLTVDLSTKTTYVRLVADSQKCTCERRTKSEQTAGVSNICADGSMCDIPAGDDWPYGYKCPLLCARREVCSERLCTNPSYDGDESQDFVKCTYTDGTVKEPPSIQNMSYNNPETEQDESFLYIEYLASLPPSMRCCIASEEDSNLDGQIQPDEKVYHTYAKMEVAGRDVTPIIYGNRGRDVPACKPGLDISKSCVFANVVSNQQLKCEEET